MYVGIDDFFSLLQSRRGEKVISVIQAHLSKPEF